MFYCFTEYGTFLLMLYLTAVFDILINSRVLSENIDFGYEKDISLVIRGDSCEEK